jgi:hypothetical protein
MPEANTRRAVVVTAVAAVTAAVTFLIAPPMGTDLSAQTARADFFSRHGFAVLDLGWYGGISPYGYSLLTPAPMAWLTPRGLGAIAGVAAAVLFVLLLLRTGARHPSAAGLLGVVGIFGNLVSGRVTFAVGVAFGLAALLAVTARSRWRWAGACAGAVLAAAASPVAGLFVGLAGAALILTPKRQVDGLALAVGAAVPTLGTALLFGTGGTMNISAWDTGRAVAASLVVAWLVPVRPIRMAALLYAAGVLAAAVVETPVGLNAVRLAAMFALPVLAGYAVLPSIVRPRIALPLVLIAVAVGQPPVSVADLRGAGDPTASRDLYRPLLDELARRQPVGRVEVVPSGDYWESAYVPGAAPLARGWLRQADMDRNPLFFDGLLTAERYENWLHDNGVSHVAVNTDTAPSWVGRRELDIITAGPDYLDLEWREAGWLLYRVTGRPSVVGAGATVVSSTDRAVTVAVETPGDVLIRVRWSRWLALRGSGCLTPGRDGWTTLRVTAPGRYRVTSAFTAGPRC